LENATSEYESYNRYIKNCYLVLLLVSMRVWKKRMENVPITDLGIFNYYE